MNRVTRLIFRGALSLFIFSLLLFAPHRARAAGDYEITDFHSQIEIQQDTSLLVTETIRANFFIDKHGIFRTIPVTYSANGKTIKAKFNILNITDERGQPYPYTTSRVAQSVELKIGDPDVTITGPHTYVIRYQIGKVLLRYDDYDEVYWNITGSEWDVPIEKSSTSLKSSFAEITRIECFTGYLGSTDSDCLKSFTPNSAQFTSQIPVGNGTDFTIVVALNPQNQLKFPGQLTQLADLIRDNIGYPIALLPLLTITYIWYKRGRDQRYVSDQIYYEPEDQKTKTVPLFNREYLPTVYSPIKGLTPAQLGTLIDQKVDIRDVVAEIIELARLKFIKIERTEEKKLFGKKVDYKFTQLKSDSIQLNDYQKHLLEKLFDKSEDSSDLKHIKMSSLKNHFYTHLNKFKELLYENMQTQQFFDGNPEKTRGKWWAIVFIINFVIGWIIVMDAQATNNFFPLITLSVSFIPSIIIANSMPRRTPRGYSLFRQATGLQWYINKSKWREEIAEKHLFLQEILPIAVSLGVVGKLTKDMADLGQQPPNYMHGVAASTFSSDMGRFESSLATNLSSTPSGKSSWSGGSGFSGGGGGGGFGGGGGGSW